MVSVASICIFSKNFTKIHTNEHVTHENYFVLDFFFGLNWNALAITIQKIYFLQFTSIFIDLHIKSIDASISYVIAIAIASANMLWHHELTIQQRLWLYKISVDFIENVRAIVVAVMKWREKNGKQSKYKRKSMHGLRRIIIKYIWQFSQFVLQPWIRASYESFDTRRITARTKHMNASFFVVH